MSETDKRFGVFNEDGTVTEPEVSILTGAAIAKVGSVRERILGTPYFYRFEGAYDNRVTDALREQWRSEAPGASGSAKRSVPAARVTEQSSQE